MVFSTCSSIFLKFLQPLRHSFLGITPHPLANRLAPNPNGHCSSLSFGSLVVSICLPLCSYLFQSFIPFFQTFSCVPTVFPGFPSCNFLIFSTVSSISLVFPSLPFIFASSLIVFSQFSFIFLHFLPVFNDVPSFSFVFSYLFPSVFRGLRENRTPPSPNCLGTCPPKKFQLATLITTRYRDFGAPGQPPPPPHPLYSLRSQKSAGFRN